MNRPVREYTLRLGVETRTGRHTGEYEVVDGKVSGVVTQMGVRRAFEAAVGEVLVSSTVKDLVAESDPRSSALICGLEIKKWGGPCRTLKSSASFISVV